MFELDHASLRLAGRAILDDVSLQVAPGRLTVVVGPNGAGKSTCIKLLSGEIRPDRGRALFEGRALRDMPAHELASRRAVLPQSAQLAFPFTVHEVVRLGIDSRKGLSDVTRRHLPQHALERVDLGGFGGRRYQELSGGEQQRVHLARVLCQVGDPVQEGRPQYLFLDEPTASLDIRHQLSTLAIARDFARAGGGALAILHDLNLAAAFADHLIVIHRGQVFAEGPPAAVITDATMSQVFGVTLRVGQTPGAGIPFVLPQSARG